MMKRMKNNAGFTMAEVLIAVVILVLITAGIMPAAMRAYKNAVDAANAQALLSTTVDALRGELSTAWNVKPVSGDSKAITYQSADTGSRTKMLLDSNVIMLQEYDDFDSKWFDSGATVTKAPEQRPLISEAMKKTTDNPQNSMSVVYTGIVPAAGYITITGLTVKRGDNEIANLTADLIIRPLGGENG